MVRCKRKVYYARFYFVTPGGDHQIGKWQRILACHKHEAKDKYWSKHKASHFFEYHEIEVRKRRFR